jgi:hypothetical protein
MFASWLVIFSGGKQNTKTTREAEAGQSLK